jgi:hypothetical protein
MAGKVHFDRQSLETQIYETKITISRGVWILLAEGGETATRRYSNVSKR